MLLILETRTVRESYLTAACPCIISAKFTSVWCTVSFWAGVLYVSRLGYNTYGLSPLWTTDFRSGKQWTHTQVSVGMESSDCSRSVG